MTRCDFFRDGEAAERLGIGPGLLDRLIRAGEVKAVRLRRRVLVPTSALTDIERRSQSRV